MFPLYKMPTDFCPFKPLFTNYQMLFKKCIHNTNLLIALRESVSIFLFVLCSFFMTSFAEHESLIMT